MFGNDQNGQSCPFVSVIVPVYNDPRGIETTIRSLVAQTYPEDRREFLVVDNGSEDHTRDVIRRFDREYHDVHLLVEDGIQGSYAARNRGLETARGSVLAFIDADMTAKNDWLEAGVQELEARDCDYVAGAVVLYTPGSDTFSDVYDRNRSFPTKRLVEQERYGQTCNLFVRRTVFDDLGPFDAGMISGGDLEFGHRVANSGHDLCFAPTVRAYHPTRSSLRELVKKYVRLGRGHQQRRRHYPERYGHPVATLLSITRWLPPVPWSIPNHSRHWERLSGPERVAIVVITYVLHVAFVWGELVESTRDLYCQLDRWNAMGDGRVG